MCQRLRVNIRPHSVHAPQIVDVPCGECEDCRNVMRTSWYVRLRCEVDARKKDNWQVGFLTLTYSEDRLPHIPKIFVKKEYRSKYSLGTPPCFCKKHIRKMLNILRCWLFDRYNCSSFSWLCAGEYGEHTHRPHYHILLCFPPFVDARAFFEKIKKYWTSHHGFVIPKDFDGGFDEKGRYHNPFLCKSADTSKACFYAAKYCCKDLAFFESFERGDFIPFVDTTKMVRKRGKMKKVKVDVRYRLRDFLCFHLQSRSLGFSHIRSLDDDTKKTYLLAGLRFAGESQAHAIPLYFRNKILFRNEYKEVNGKRVVFRYANDFFRKNYRMVFEDKVEKLAENLKKWRNLDYWRQFVPYCGDYLLFDDLQTKFRNMDDRQLASEILAFAGGQTIVYRALDYVDNWFLRYRHDFPYAKIDCDWEHVDPSHLFDITMYYGLMLDFYNASNTDVLNRKQKESRELSRIRDKLRS